VVDAIEDIDGNVLNLDPNSDLRVNRLSEIRISWLQRFSVSFHQLLTTHYFAKAVHDMQPHDIKKKIGRFRILVVGRANAGKTTLLQRVCNTTENPEVFNGAGKKVNTTFCATSESPTDQSDQINAAIVKSTVYVCAHRC